MNRIIEIFNESNLVELDEAQLKNFIYKLDEDMPKEFKATKGWLSVAVMDDEHLAQIHAEFLDDPKITDVITFTGDAEDDFLGEVCISAQRALEVASEFNLTADCELALYLAHGYFHLAGIDDIEEADALIMRKAEALALEIIQKDFKNKIFKYKK